MSALSTLPALSENRRLRPWAFFLFYISQGVPFGLLMTAIPAWLAANGASPSQIGFYLSDVSLWQDSRLYIAWNGVTSVPLFLFYLANLVMAMRVTAAEVAATAFSVLMAVGAVGFLIASAILPYLENFGGFQAMFGASAVLVCFAGLLTLLLHKDVRQAVAEEQA